MLLQTPYGHRVTTLKDVSAELFIEAMAQHLQRSGKFVIPAWIDYAKSSHGKELPPMNDNWLYVRSASILRSVYDRNSGVGGLRKKYATMKRKGFAPSHRALSGGKALRHCVQQLEKMGYVKVAPKGGRCLTDEGRREVNQVARNLVQRTA